MAKSKYRSRKRKQYAIPEPGTTPGYVYIDEKSLTPKITLHIYNQDTYEEVVLNNLEGIKEKISDKKYTYWIDIKGFKSARMFEVLNDEFNVHRLVLEDITRSYHRPKFEEYEGYAFAISRMLRLDPDESLWNEQLSFILTKNTLITLQENYDDCLGAVRKRLKVGKGNIRIAGPGYLLYALMDMVVDSYFSILNIWNERLDMIEDRLLDKPDKSVMFETQMIKRDLIAMRRVVWPERDKMNDILRSDSSLITEQTRLFIKDAYDHCVQIIDMVESIKEIAATNIDMYLSIISNRMNEIMKVLTIISSIFIPLTFIAGIYGMNFSKQDPVTGKIMPQNMPELYQEHGYLYTIIVMGVIALLQVLYFWRKGWFK